MKTSTKAIQKILLGSFLLAGCAAAPPPPDVAPSHPCGEEPRARAALLLREGRLLRARRALEVLRSQCPASDEDERARQALSETLSRGDADGLLAEATRRLGEGDKVASREALHRAVSLLDLAAHKSLEIKLKFQKQEESEVPLLGGTLNWDPTGQRVLVTRPGSFVLRSAPSWEPVTIPLPPETDFGHTFSGDGAWLAFSATEKEQVLLWRMGGKTIEKTFPFKQTGGQRLLDFSPDSRYLLTTNSETLPGEEGATARWAIEVFDLKSKAKIASLKPDSPPKVDTNEVQPAGLIFLKEDLLASFWTDDKMRVWQFPSGKLVQTAQAAFDSNAAGLIASRRGGIFAWTSEPMGSPVVWKPGTPPRKLPGCQVVAMGLSHDGALLAGGLQNDFFCLFDTRTGQRLRVFGQPSGRNRMVTPTLASIWFSADSKTIFAQSSHGSDTRAWNTDTGKPAEASQTQAVPRFREDTDRIAASAGVNMFLAIQDDKKEVCSLREGSPMSCVDRTQIKPGPPPPAGAPRALVPLEHGMVLVDPSSGHRFARLDRRVPATFSGSDFNRGNTLLAARSEPSEQALVFDAATGRELSSASRPLRLGPPEGLVFTRDTLLLQEEGRVQLSIPLTASGAASTTITRLPPPLLDEFPWRVSRSSDGTREAATVDQRLVILERSSGKRWLPGTPKDPPPLGVGAFTADGSALAVLHEDGMLRLWPAQGGDARWSWRAKEARELPFALSPDGQTLFVHEDQTIRAVRPGDKTSRPLAKIENIKALALHPAGSVLGAIVEGKVVLLRSSDGALLGRIEISPDGAALFRDSKNAFELLGPPGHAAPVCCQIAYRSIEEAPCVDAFHVRGLLAEVIERPDLAG